MQVGAVNFGRVAPCWRLGGAKNRGVYIATAEWVHTAVSTILWFCACEIAVIMIHAVIAMIILKGNYFTKCCILTAFQRIFRDHRLHRETARSLQMFVYILPMPECFTETSPVVVWLTGLWVLLVVLWDSLSFTLSAARSPCGRKLALRWILFFSFSSLLSSLGRAWVAEEEAESEESVPR